MKQKPICGESKLKDIVPIILAYSRYLEIKRSFKNK